MQDVIVQKKSIRDISLPKRRIDTSKNNTPIINDEDTPPKKINSYNFDYNNDEEKGGRKGLYVSLFIFIIAIIFGISSLFNKAKVEVVVKNKVLPISLSYSAKKDAPSGEFGYQVVSVSSVTEEIAKASKEEMTESKASGQIIIYNTGSKPQKLVTNTRFETPNGLIFRIQNDVTVPKSSTLSGKSVPGSIEALVYADKAGENYNTDLTDFTLPGLKNTSAYKEVYARSKTKIQGGFSGMMKVVGEETKKEIGSKMDQKLKEDLTNQITSQIPENFIVFKNGIEFLIESPNQKKSDGENVIISKKGIANALIFDKKILTSQITKDINSDINITEFEDVSLQNLSDLNFDFASGTNIKSSNEVKFNLSGDLNIIWNFDENELKNDLLGINKNKMNGLLMSKYTGIEKADASIFPFWKTSFPLKIDKIEIVKVPKL